MGDRIKFGGGFLDDGLTWSGELEGVEFLRLPDGSIEVTIGNRRESYGRVLTIDDVATLTRWLTAQPDEAVSPGDDPPAQSAPPAEILELARKAAALTVDRVDELAQVDTVMRRIIADGEVTADDFRWLTDLAPGLVQLAANNMNGPRQGMRTPRLRGMVLEGLISAEAFCAAILRAAPDIERDHTAWLARQRAGHPKA